MWLFRSLLLRIGFLPAVVDEGSQNGFSIGNSANAGPARKAARLIFFEWANAMKGPVMFDFVGIFRSLSVAVRAEQTVIARCAVYNDADDGRHCLIFVLVGEVWLGFLLVPSSWSGGLVGIKQFAHATDRTHGSP